MRGVGKWGTAAALLLAVAVSVAAARDGDGAAKPPASGSGWMSGWWGPKDKGGLAKEAPDPPGPSAVNLADAARQREINAYLRRILVCDKLAQAADNTNDEKLMHEVEELKERVWAIYQQRTAHLSDGAATVDSDEANVPAGRKSAKDRFRGDKP
jgi:hypothetical protein